jgi:hypothetical protein
MSTSINQSFRFEPWFVSSISDDDFDCSNSSSTISQPVANFISEEEICGESCTSSTDYNEYILEKCLEPTPIGPYGILSSSNFHPVIPAYIPEISRSYYYHVERIDISNGEASDDLFPQLFPEVTSHMSIPKPDDLQGVRISCSRKRCVSDIGTIDQNEVNESSTTDMVEETFSPRKKARHLPCTVPSEKNEPPLVPSSPCCIDNDAPCDASSIVAMVEPTQLTSHEPDTFTSAMPVDNDFSASDDEMKERFRMYQNGQWNEKFAELVEFQVKNGHCVVPHNYVESPALAQWVKR